MLRIFDFLNWNKTMNELLSSGIELMLIGMGIVYTFLAVLVFAINLMSALIQRFFPPLPAKLVPSTTGAQPENDEEAGIVAAITAAVHQYRHKYHQ